MAKALQRIDLSIFEKNQLQLWRLNTDTFAYKKDDFNILSNDEQQRALRLKNKSHRQRFTIARVVLRQLLAKQLACLPEDIQFSYNYAGRPTLKYLNNTLIFNISHADEITLIAIADNLLVGVDIEKNIHPINPLQIANNVFSAKEIQYLNHAKASSQLTLFYRIWVIKEAVIKLLGTGFSLDPCSFCIRNVLNGNPFLDLSIPKSNPPMPSCIQIIEPVAYPHHASALAISYIR